ncbi:cbb3-type cytochrome oxidase subunit 3 [Roseospira navarrensis]|uniref:CcoQ/FixQ family Cbb3-type cytochrome c oxidase assembly chaperone n=1 Tax=Roseospira navarrensis TaxID=140058 RepID=A0A7X1ZEQ3_9PROT|nr:cbb3-type cytochrome c oxidase subunit 3 [Roseospira navarrensis]MQX36933.1 CcoQ/FixQ family Cbb3-type cytochrome c oxidase assembly chaperone [Roseospira navarrensis]
MDSLDQLSDFLRQFWGLWLMLLFLGIVWWAYRPKNKDRFKDDAMIPLRDDETVEENDNGRSS